ncbi:MAG: hypothetical protein LBE91_02005, partial [Tannerella sp.]|nr:hypothetical protein [Tannerella sp.]
KVNITIKDLRLYDVLIYETTVNSEFQEKDFIRREFFRYVFVTPDNYWAYGYYEFKVINNGIKPIAYKENFFRDGQGALINQDQKVLQPGAEFLFLQKDYLNPVDQNREIYPFVDFVTESNWTELSNYISAIYQDIIAKQAFSEFAPELKKTLDDIDNKERQIAYAIEYVQNNIKYIYDAEAMHGHKPQEAAITYTNKQGDCKAKCILLKVILDYLNVKSDIILVNYGTDFYHRYYLPSLLSFNHVVLKINHNGNDYFVDATSTDEYGFLENRGFISFCHYLEINPDKALEKRGSFRYPQFCVEEKVTFSVQKEVGELNLQTVFRHERANNIRRYFKNTNKQQIIDNWLNMFADSLSYSRDRHDQDLRTVFENVELNLTEDNKELNEVTVKFSAKVNHPYFVDKNKNNRRFLMFFDYDMVNRDVQTYNQQQDFTYWHYLQSDKREIHLSTDLKIDTREKYTVQECDINNPYFTHKVKKEITKHSGSAFIEYNPVANIEVPQQDIPRLKADYSIVADSNYGIGIDIIEPGFLNELAFSIKRLVGN